MTRAITRPFTGRHMLAILLAFFGTVLAANMVMVYYANHSWTGLVVKNSYVASQEFNETTEKLARAEAGVHVTPAYQNGSLSVRLVSDTGEPVIAGNVVIKLGRPSHEGEDREVKLESLGNGNYAAPHVLGKGQWSGSVTADVPGHESWMRPVLILVRD